MSMTDACPGCGAIFPVLDGPVHEYMTSSPGCWRAYGEVLAREYQNPALLAVHRLSVDAYAAQHPGGDSRQAIQSVGVHLARLCLFLEHGLSPEAANAAMLKVGQTKAAMVKLAPPTHPGEITVANVLAAEGDDAHMATVRAWARSVWFAWAMHHTTIREWANTGLRDSR
jgi:hypothetical protein